MTSEADAAPLMAKEEPVTAQETEPVRAETSVEQDGKPIASAAVPPTEGEQQDDSVHPTEEKQNGEQRTAQTPEAYKAPLPAPSFDLGQDPIYIYGQVELPNEGILPTPGPSYETAKMTQLLLQENHCQWHCFFTAGGLHNHVSHHVLAAYSMGAPSSSLLAAYELHDQMPMELPRFRITESNFGQYLGQDDAYSSYLAFFHSKIQESSSAEVIERFVFSDSVHRLLVRLVSGAIHPLIQMGHGVEFGLDALVAEGLAQACVHSAQAEALFPPTWPLKNSERFRSSSVNSFSNFASRLGANLGVVSGKKENFFAAARGLSKTRQRTCRLGLSGFSILGNILRDPRLAPGEVNSPSDSSKFTSALKNKGDVIARWTEEWVIDPEGGFEEIVSKTEELFWMATVILAASSRPGYQEHKLDFFLMHALTSVIFLPSLVEVLKPASRIALLYSHFKVMIGYWVSRGRPALHIKDTLLAATATPTPPNTPLYLPGALERAATEKKEQAEGKGKQKASDQEVKTPTLSSMATPARNTSTNPWTTIMASAADHADEHLTKTVRSLAYAASMWGTTPAGVWKSALPESDLLDGQVFVRAAGMALDTIGWAREDSAEAGKWDRSTLGFDSAWEGVPRSQEQE